MSVASASVGASSISPPKPRRALELGVSGLDLHGSQIAGRFVYHRDLGSPWQAGAVVCGIEPDRRRPLADQPRVRPFSDVALPIHPAREQEAIKLAEHAVGDLGLDRPVFCWTTIVLPPRPEEPACPKYMLLIGCCHDSRTMRLRPVGSVYARRSRPTTTDFTGKRAVCFGWEADVGRVLMGRQLCASLAAVR